MKILIAIVLLLAGAVWCLFGYRLFRPLSSLLGLLACGTTGYCIADYYKLSTVYVLLIAAAAGLAGGILAFWLVRVHAFLAGLICGILAVLSSLAMLTGNNLLGALSIAEEHPVLYLALTLAAGILLGLLCAIFFKPAILLLSAASGALLFTGQFQSFLTMEDKYIYIMLGISALIGILVQILTTGGLIHDKKDQKKADSGKETANGAVPGIGNSADSPSIAQEVPVPNAEPVSEPGSGMDSAAADMQETFGTDSAAADMQGVSVTSESGQ